MALRGQHAHEVGQQSRAELAAASRAVAERGERARDRLVSAIANFKDLDLTDDQKSKITAIREEYRPKVHEAGNKLRAAVRDELSQILDIMKG